MVWEASDRLCGKRLRPLVPTLVEAMKRHGHVQLAPEVRAGLLAMMAATADRSLREARGQAGGRTLWRTAPSAAVLRSVPVRTFEGWDDPAPGLMEADLVAHSGPAAKGSFVQTLTLTNIAAGRCHGASHRRLSALRGAGGGGDAGPALPFGASVGELLPALVQAGRQVARRGAREEALPPAGDALPTCSRTLGQAKRCAAK